MAKSVVRFSLFVIVIAVIVGGIALLGQGSVTTVAPYQGTADLTGVDLERQVAMITNWQSYKGQFLMPSAILGSAAISGADSVYGTYFLEIIVPTNNPYILAFNSVEFSTKVYINQKEIEEIGRVSQDKEDFVPARKYCYYIAQPQDKYITILIHYANHYTGFTPPPTLYISTSSPMLQLLSHKDLLRFSLMTLYVAAFLLCFGIFLFHPKRKENLYFALTCLLLGIRESLIGEQFVSSIFPNLSWDGIFLVQYILVGLLVILLFSFILSVFPFIISSKIKKSFYIACILFIGGSFLTRAYMPSVGTILFLGIGIAIMLYITISLVRRFNQVPRGNQLSAVGVFLLFASIINDMFHHFKVSWGGIGQFALLQRVMILFIFIQIIALFIQFMTAEAELYKAKEKQQLLLSENEMLSRINVNRAKFLSDISHELKTPLTVVSNYAQLTRLHQQESAVPDEYSIHKMTLVVSEIQRMALMVEQLIEIARIEEGQMAWNFAEVEIESVIKETIERYYPVLNKNHNLLETHIASSLPSIYADANRLSQVLVNLISNAVKFTKHGTITIDAIYTKGDYIQLTVTDTGSGMSSQVLSNLFVRYYSNTGEGANLKGTGLGLVISKEIIEAHHGRLEISSELESGTVVKVFLPIMTSALAIKPRS